LIYKREKPIHNSESQKQGWNMKINFADIKMPMPAQDAAPDVSGAEPVGQEVKAAVLEAIAPQRGNMSLLDG
jgi:hypothetical protein